MIIIDTSRCPIQLVYNRGTHSCEIPGESEPCVFSIPDQDIMELTYKKNKLLMKPHSKFINITGDPVELALGISLLISDTIYQLKNDIIDEAFEFSKNGIEKINWLDNGYAWGLGQIDIINKFVEEYNRVWPTVLLLK